jgi:hypothetical protein
MAAACSLATAPAHARARVFVASYGNDSNPCTFLSPCKTFQVAVNTVDAGGEVAAIDSAGFGPINITKAVTITSPPGVEASIATSTGQTAITIAAGPNDSVTLRGLTLNGAGAGNYGVNFTSGYKLAVLDCFVTDYTVDAIFVNVTATTIVLISNTAIFDAPAGLVLQTAANGAIIATVDHSTFDNNQDSIELNNNGTGLHDMTVFITNSKIGADTSVGIYAAGSLVGHASLTLKNVTFTSTVNSIYLTGYAQVFLSQVTQPGSTFQGVYCTGGGVAAVHSDGTSHLGYDPTCNGLIDSWVSK